MPVMKMRPSYLLYGILFLLFFGLLSAKSFSVKVMSVPISIGNPFNLIGNWVLYNAKSLHFQFTFSTLILLLAIIVLLYGLFATDYSQIPMPRV